MGFGTVLDDFREETNVLELPEVEQQFHVQINQPNRCINHSALLPVVKYSSTCFGHPHAHHQELINCSSRLWFTVGT